MDAFTNPAMIGSKVEKNFRPYFPKVHVLVSRPQKSIVVITCLENEGPELVEKMATVLRETPEISQLSMVSSTYQSMGIFFRHRMIGYDISTNTIGTGQTPVYITSKYDEVCSEPEQVMLDPRDKQ
jgi:hypothetical protein